MKGGKQIVEVGSSCTNGRMDRMILQTLGHQYEHTRPDRDSYITVNYGNIESGKETEFDVQPDPYAPVIPYDYDSVMHLSTTAYSDGTGPSITPLNGVSEHRLGQEDGLSQFDITRINMEYCPGWLRQCC